MNKIGTGISETTVRLNLFLTKRHANPSKGIQKKKNYQKSDVEEGVGG